MNRSSALCINDILENMAKAEDFTAGMTYEQFAKDEKPSYAAMRCLEIIGEAEKNIPHHLRRQHQAIPWKKTADMRDKAIHFYFGINYRAVWLTIKNDIPILRPLLENVRSELNKTE